MSDSLTVETSYPTAINVTDLAKRVGDNLRYLLHQDETFSPDFEVLRVKGDLEKASTLVPCRDLYTLFEHRYLHRGSNFRYCENRDWRPYGDGPKFQFDIVEIKRDFDSMVMAVCLALAMSVADIFSVSEIIDGHGVWVKGRDEVSLQALRDLRIKEALPISEAVQELYKKLPLR